MLAMSITERKVFGYHSHSRLLSTLFSAHYQNKAKAFLSFSLNLREDVLGQRAGGSKRKSPPRCI